MSIAASCFIYGSFDGYERPNGVKMLIRILAENLSEVDTSESLPHHSEEIMYDEAMFNNRDDRHDFSASCFIGPVV